MSCLDRSVVLQPGYMQAMKAGMQCGATTAASGLST